jgi:hypothetical protein
MPRSTTSCIYVIFKGITGKIHSVLVVIYHDMLHGYSLDDTFPAVASRTIPIKALKNDPAQWQKSSN